MNKKEIINSLKEIKIECEKYEKCDLCPCHDENKINQCSLNTDCPYEWDLENENLIKLFKDYEEKGIYKVERYASFLASIFLLIYLIFSYKWSLYAFALNLGVESSIYLYRTIKEYKENNN